MALVMFALSVIVYDILTVKICKTLTFRIVMSFSNATKEIESQQATSCVFQIEIFVISFCRLRDIHGENVDDLDIDL